MPISGRREVGDVLIGNRFSRGPEVLDRPRHVHRVSDDDRVGHQVEAADLNELVFVLALADLPRVGKEQEPPERMQGFAPVELPVNLPTENLIREVAQDEDRLDQAAVLLERLREGARRRRSPAECAPPLFYFTCNNDVE